MKKKYTSLIKQQFFFIVLTFTTLLYVKYFFQNWHADEINLIDSISNMVTCLSLLFCSLAFYISNKKEKVIFIIVTLFFLLNFLLNSNVYFFWCFIAFPLLVFYSRITNKLAITILSLSLLLAWAIFLPFELFFSDNIFFIDDRYIRLSLGLKNPNTLALVTFILYTLLLCWVSYINHFTIKMLLLLIISICIFTILWYTVSRTFIATSILAFLFFLIQNHDSLIPKRKSYLLLLFFIIVFQLTSTFYYNNNNILAALDSLLSWRILLANFMYENLGSPNILLGYDIQTYKPIDFFFINLLYSSGWLFFLIFIMFICKISKKLNNIENIFAVMIFLMLLISITESIFNVIFLNYSLLLLYKIEK